MYICYVYERHPSLYYRTRLVPVLGPIIQSSLAASIFSVCPLIGCAVAYVASRWKGEGGGEGEPIRFNLLL